VKDSIPIALGAGCNGEVHNLVALTLDYFDPNGKLIIDDRQTIYWNDLTGEKDAYGLAIATANPYASILTVPNPNYPILNS
jgi:hypothetical protein